MDWCDSSHGIHLSAYDEYRNIASAMYQACSIWKHTISLISRWAYIVLPNDWVIPLVEDGEPPFNIPDDKTFWAIRFTIFKQAITIPLPKQNLNSMWQAFVAPADYYVPNSQMWPYMVKEGDVTDNSTPVGDITQGFHFSPPKLFGLLSQAPTIIKDLTIITVIYIILDKIGLLGLAKSFINALTMKYKHMQLMSDIEEMRHEMIDLEADVAAQIGVLDGKLTEIKTVMGLKLLLT